MGSGSWSIILGEGGSLTDPTLAATQFLGVEGESYTLQWQTTNDGLTSSDFVNIRFSSDNEIVNNLLLVEWGNEAVIKSRGTLTLDALLTAGSNLRFQAQEGIEFSRNTEIESGAQLELHILECMD